MLLRRVVAAALAAVAFAPEARAIETAACLDASEQAQVVRDEGHFLDARAKLVTCSSEQCPQLVRADCIKWLAELEPRIPTLVVRARDASGHDVVDVRTYVDGALVATRLQGRAMPIDPGPHVLRFERDGAAPIEERLLAREGERERLVDVAFPAPRRREAQEPPARPFPIGPVVLGAAGAAGVAMFTVLASQAKSEVDGYRGTCAPSCNPSDVSGTKTKLVVGDVALVAGIVALGVAAFWYFSGADAKAPPRAAWAF